MFRRGTPRLCNWRINWNMRVVLPLRRGPIQTVALPGTGVTCTRRGTPVGSSASWESRMISLSDSAMWPTPF